MKKIFIGITTSLLINTAHSSSIKEYVSRSLVNMSLKEKYESSLSEVQKQASYETLLKNPTVDLEYGRLKNTGIIGSLVGASLHQEVPINGKRSLTSKTYKEIKEQKLIQQQWETFNLSSQIILHFLNLWLEREKIEHSRHRIKDLGVIKNYLKNRKFSSPQQKSDAYLVKKRIEEIEFQLKKNSSAHKSLEKYLKFISQSQSIDFNIKLRDAKDLRTALRKIENDDSLIQSYRKSLRNETNLKINSHGRDWIPDLNFSYSYFKENVPGGNLGHAVGLSFDIPLFSTGKTKVDQLKANLQYSQAQWRYQDLTRKATAEEIATKFEYNLDLIGDQNLMSKEQTHRRELKKIKDFFLKGLINAQTYLEAENLNHELHYRQVEATLNIIRALLEMAHINQTEFSLDEVLL